MPSPALLPRVRAALASLATLACAVAPSRASDLDTAFSADVRSFGVGRAVAVAGDGSLVVGGQFALAEGQARANLARYRADGTLDTAFVPAAANGDIRAVALEPDGKVVIAGAFTTVGGIARNRVARLNADGSLDTGFNPGSGFDAEVLALVRQPDGKLIAGGAFGTFNGTARGRVARLNANGSLDTTFLASGAGANGLVWSIALQADGKPVLGGAFTTYNGTTRNRVARLTTAGALDTGIAFTGGANGDVYAVALDSTGRFLVGGAFTSWNGTARNVVARLGTNGDLDTTFSTGTTLQSADNQLFVTALAVTPTDTVLVGGKLLVVNNDGSVTAGVARFTTSGSRDTAFQPAATVLGLNRSSNPLSYVHALALGSDLGVFAAGYLHDPTTGASGLLRLTATGGRPTGASPRGLEFAPVVNAVRPGAGGRTYVAGDFNWAGGAPRDNVARLLPNGRADAGWIARYFGAGSGFDANPTEVVELPNGHLRVFGAFTKFGTSNQARSVRLGTDGSLVGTDTELPITGGVVRRALLDPSGRLVLAGTFTNVKGTARAGVARVDATAGTVDTAFAPGAGPTGGEILDAAVDGEGRVLLAGTFTGFSGTAEPHLVRLGAGGTVDAGFAALASPSGRVNSVSVLPGDAVLIGGAFANSGGFAVNGVDRLLATGASDPAFNPGTGANAPVLAARPRADGTILVVGDFTSFRGEPRAGLALLAGDGSLAPLLAATDPGAGSRVDVLPLADGKALLRGGFPGALARLHGTAPRRGLPDSFLDGATLANGRVWVVLPEADGGFLLAGDFTSVGGTTRGRVAKVDATGRLVAARHAGSGFNGEVLGALRLPGGGALLWGSFTALDGASAQRVVRLLPDGSRDTGFVAPSFGGAVNAAALLPDGRVLVAGSFETVAGQPVARVARLAANGALDATFSVGTGPNAAVHALVAAPGGRWVLGGAFSTFAGANAPGLVRLEADGARDASFVPGTGPASVTSLPVRAVAALPGGGFLVGGDFTSFDGRATGGLVRLGTDGAPDPAFLGGLGADGSVLAIATLADGRVLLGGNFTSLGGSEKRRLARLTATGALDPVLDVGTGFDAAVRVVAPLADGRVAVGGDFANASGKARSRFALLYAGDAGVPTVPGDTRESLEVEPGAAFALGFDASPEGLRFQWYREGVAIPGATGPSYAVASASLADLGRHRLLVANGSGEFLTEGTDVVVRLAPAITSAPVAVSVGYGATATFAVSAVGPGTLTYQWLRDGEAIPGQTGPSLTVADAGDATFGRTYSVRITNAYGSVTTTPVALTFDPTATPGATVDAFPGRPFTRSEPTAIARDAQGRFYVGGFNYVVRLLADGSEDPAFALPFAVASVQDLAVQADGKLLVAAQSNVVAVGTTGVFRVESTGALDTGFAPVPLTFFNGSFSQNASGLRLGLQSDGRVVVVGNFNRAGTTERSFLARLNAAGGLDTSFGAALPNAIVRAVAVSGTTVHVAGDFTQVGTTAANRVARLTSTGAVDTAFATAGGADAPVQAMLLAPDGKLVLVGSFSTIGGVPRPGVARLNANGSVDTAFDPGVGPSRTLSIDTVSLTGLALAEGGLPVIIGSFERWNGVPTGGAVRLAASGSLDTQWAFSSTSGSFSRLVGFGDGTLLGVTHSGLRRLLSGNYPPRPPAIRVQPSLPSTATLPAGSRVNLAALASGPGTLAFQWLRDDQPVVDSTMVVGAQTASLVLRSIRAAEAGTYRLRVTSSTTGVTLSEPVSVVVGAEGQGPGSLDLAWAGDTASFANAPSVVLPLPDGTFLVAVPARFEGTGQIVALDAAGRRLPASTWSTGTGFGANGLVGLARQSDGRILVGGSFDTVQGAAVPYLARLNANGSRDTAFSLAANGAVTTLVPLPDGKVLLAGNFTTLGGTARDRVARLNANGTLDTAFAPGAHGLTDVRRAVAAPDGKVLLLGRPSTGSSDEVVRLNANGSVDGTFSRASASSGAIASIAVDSTGRVLLGGRFTTLNGSPANRIARLGTNGAIDPAYGPVRSAGPDDDVDLVFPAPDGWTYVGGDFDSWDGFALGNLVRLDGTGKLDTSFPASGLPRFENLFSATLGWQGDRLQLSGFFSGPARSTLVRLATTGGPTGAPVLVASSGDRTVAEGGLVTLQVRFEGAVPMTFSWRRDGQLVDGAASSQLTLPAAGPADAGTYVVTATNAQGSTTATLRLAFLPPTPLAPVSGLAVGTGFDNSVDVGLRLADGSTLLAGRFTTVNGTTRAGLARFTPAGQLDTAFVPALAATTASNVVAAWQEPDGRLLVFGNLRLADQTGVVLVRLTTTGAVADVLLDSASVTGGISHVARLADGRLLVAGSNLTAIRGQARRGLARLLANGALDTAFTNPLVVTGNLGLTALAVDSDGRILLGGDFATIGGRPSLFGVARLLADGSPDTTWRLDARFLQPPSRLVPGPAGTVVATLSTTNAMAVIHGREAWGLRLAANGTTEPGWLVSQPVGTWAQDPLGRVVIASSQAISRLSANGQVERSVATNTATRVLVPGDARLVAALGFTWQVNGTTLQGAGLLEPGPEADLAALETVPVATTLPFGSSTLLLPRFAAPTSATFQWLREGSPIEGATASALVVRADVAGTTTRYVLRVTAGTRSIDLPPQVVTVLPFAERPGELVQGWGPGFPVVGYRTGGALPDDSLILAGDGQVGGLRVPVVRIRADGTPDPAFSLSPRLTEVDRFVAVHVLGDGRVFLAGSMRLDGNLVRLVQVSNEGAVVDSFVPPPVSGVQSILALPEGRILITGVGTWDNVSVTGGAVRLAANGTRDNAYVLEGLYASQLFGSTATRAWMLAGETNGGNVVVALAPDGTPDPAVPRRTYTRNALSESAATTATPTGDLLVLAWRSGSSNDGFRYRLTRFPANGGDPRGLDLPVLAGTSLFSLGLGSDATGRPVIAGGFAQADGVTAHGLLRLLPDGSPDPTWATPALPQGSSAFNPQGLLFLRSGSRLVVLGGEIPTFGLPDRSELVALHAGEAPASAPLLARGVATSRVIPPYDPLGLALPVVVPAGATVQWTRNGVALAGETGPRLWRRAANADDSGLYRAVVTTPGGSTTTEPISVSIAPTVYSGGLSDNNLGAVADAPASLAVPRPGGGALVVSTGMVVNGEGPFELVLLRADGSFERGLPTRVDNRFSSTSSIRAAAFDSQGRILIGGSFRAVDGTTRNLVARLLPDGRLDPSFDPGQGPSSDVVALAVDSADRVLISGSFGQVNGQSRPFLARLTTTGALDTSFAIGNGPAGAPAAMLPRADGSVILGGSFTTWDGAAAARLVRVLADGTRDASFTPSPSAAVTALSPTPDGGFVVGGSFQTISGQQRQGLARFSPDLALLPVSYDGSSSYTSLAMGEQADVYALSGGSVWRFLENGTRDQQFLSASSIRGGFRAGNSTNSVAPTSLVAGTGGVLAAGPFVRVGESTRMGLAWLRALDTDGPTITSVPADTVAPEGGRVSFTVGLLQGSSSAGVSYAWYREGADAILSTNTGLTLTNLRTTDSGTYRFEVASGAGLQVARVRLEVTAAPTPPAPGQVVLGFLASGSTGSAQAILPAGEGRWWLLEGGSLARLTAEGGTDTTFARLSLGGTAQSSALDDQGRLYVGSNLSSTGFRGITRLLPDGTVDPSFQSPLPSSTGSVLAIVPIAGGGCYVGGTFRDIPVGASLTSGVIRLRDDGSIDPAFRVFDAREGSVAALAVDREGRLLVGGGFLTVRAAPLPRLVRVLADGRIDLAFSNPEVDPGAVAALAEDAEGRILVGGSFTRVGGSTTGGLVRLLPGGTRDLSFVPLPFASPSVSSIVVRPDSRLLVAFGLSGNQLRVVQLLDDGSLDPAYDAGLVFSTSPTNARLLGLPDGRFFLAGNITSLSNGVYRPGVVQVQGTSLLPPRESQGITFPALADRAFAFDPIDPGATASSGLPVAYAVVSGPARIEDGLLQLTGAGTVVVRASQEGDAAWLPAEPVERAFAVTANLDSWRASVFTPAELADPAVGGVLADPDGDGRVNLEESAFGTSPFLRDRPAITQERVPFGWILRYAVPVAGIPGVSVGLEVSTDGRTWIPVPAEVERVENGIEHRWLLFFLDGNRTFARLRVTRVDVP